MRTSDSRRRVAIAAGLTAAFMLAEVAGGLISGSLALLADAAEQAAMPTRAAAHLAAHYTWDRLGDTLDAFYHTVHAQK